MKMKIPNKIKVYVKSESEYLAGSAWTIREYTENEIKSIEKRKDGVIHLEIYGLDQNYHQGGYDDGFVDGFLTEQEFWKYQIIYEHSLYTSRTDRLLKEYQENLTYLQKKVMETV